MTREEERVERLLSMPEVAWEDACSRVTLDAELAGAKPQWMLRGWAMSKTIVEGYGSKLYKFQFTTKLASAESAQRRTRVSARLANPEQTKDFVVEMSIDA